MKILLLTASTGEGHNAMARAYKEEFEKQGVTAEIFDIFAHSAALDRTFNKGYFFAVKYFPHIYDIIWSIGRRRCIKNGKNTFKSTVKKIEAPLLAKIAEFQPDMIISVHVNCGAAVEFLRRRDKIDKKILHAVVVFDYVICPYFELSRTADIVLTPSEVCHAELLKKGFDEKKIACFGFPVSSRFLSLPQKAEARKALGLDDKFTVFTIAGGAGLGSTVGLVKSVVKRNPDVQMIAVCGRNEKQRQKLQAFVDKSGAKNVKVLGFSTNVPELMAAADVAFARGGGNGASECFYANLPIIFREGLINNEKVNRKLFVSAGMCDAIKRKSQAGKKVEFFKNNTGELDKMREKIKAFVKPQPVANAVEFLKKRVEARSPN